ncbi:hypothetical protein M0R45_024978 [Rubus argutus]|uniref:Uncharacterized protein n=1 Tax=Rubus argutus TaxID=59490 RepID=A0AAW1WWN6_RUBAR
MKFRLSASFSKENRRASHARVYAPWNTTSLSNIVVAFICGIFHYDFSFVQPPDLSNTWNTRRDDDKLWLLQTVLLLFKLIQARFVDRHIANLEIQDYSLFCPDPDAFWAFGHLRLAHKRKERQYIKVPMSRGFSVILTVTSEALILCFSTSVASIYFVNAHRCGFHRCF